MDEKKKAIPSEAAEKPVKTAKPAAKKAAAKPKTEKPAAKKPVAKKPAATQEKAAAKTVYKADAAPAKKTKPATGADTVPAKLARQTVEQKIEMMEEAAGVTPGEAAPLAPEAAPAQPAVVLPVASVRAVQPIEAAASAPAEMPTGERAVPEAGGVATPAAQRAKEQAGPAAPMAGKENRVWKNVLWPITTLLAICIITSLLLGVTNEITAPVIAAAGVALAEDARRELLPAADGFEEISITAEVADVTSLHEATNGAGYVIGAYGRGYGGKVPLLVGIDTKGTITGVKFLENNETPGLGKKLNTEPWFAEQFVGLPNLAVQPTGIDALASATVSSNAAVAGINAAIALYNEQILGIDPANLTPDQVLAMLLPDAGSLTEITLDVPGVTEAYRGGDGNYIIFGQATGAKKGPVTAAVSMTPEGVVLGLWLDTSNESPGYGLELAQNADFVRAFAGHVAPVEVDVIAGVTISSDAVGEAVDVALAALPAAKEAA